MLVLTRKVQEVIKVGEDITITIIRVKGQAVRIGIEAPRDMKVIRAELEGRPAREEEVEASTEQVETLELVVQEEEETVPASNHRLSQSQRLAPAQRLPGSGELRRAPLAHVLGDFRPLRTAQVVRMTNNR